MKIILKNFKCYKDSSFDLGEKGSVLIQGYSGIGKSSILNGIFFCLFGQGNDIIKDGEKNCSVQLILDDNSNIIRTKRPNTLTFIDKNGNEIHDDEAQNKISSIFGNNYNITGYISQDCNDSFIMLSPSDKLEFLENFIFKNFDIVEKREKCKSMIKKREQELEKCVREIELNTKILEEIEKPKNIKFPIKNKSIDDIKEIEEKLSVKINKLLSKIKESKSLIIDSENKIKNIEKDKIYISTKIEEKDRINKNIESLKEELSCIIYKGDENINELKKKLDNIIKSKEYFLLKDEIRNMEEQLKMMQNSENDEIENNISSLKEQISIINIKELNDDKIELNSIIKNIEKFIENYKKIDIDNKYINIKNVENPMIYINKELNTLNNEKRNILEEINIKKSKLELIKKIIFCPKCNTSLIFDKDKLCIKDDIKKSDNDISIIEGDIENLKNKIKNLDKDIKYIENLISKNSNIITEIYEISNIFFDEYDSIYNMYNFFIQELKDKKELFNNISESITNYNNNNKELIKLNNKKGKLSSSLTNFKSKIDEKNIKLNSLDMYSDINISEEEFIRDEIIKQTNNKQKIDNINKNLFTLQKTLDKINIEISNKKIEEINLSELNDIIEINNKFIQEFEENIEITKNTQKKLDEYKKNEAIKIKYNEKIINLQKLQTDEIYYKDKLTSANILKEKIAEAESITLINIIDIINTHTQIYLDYFFPDNPINVKLLPFKETKKNTKPSINIEVEYKGMTCTLSRLSGGQKSRVILAYTLALSEMFNLPLIMIDECTSSLDQELNGIVMDCIKEYFSEKLVIVISHQSVEGIFDRVIKLSDQ